MNKLKSKIKILYAKFVVGFFGIIWKEKRKKKQYILFESFDGVQYSDNPRAISEKIHECNPSITIIWHLLYPEKIGDFLPEYILIAKSRFDFFKSLAKSFCFVKNTQFSLENPKLQHQIFIQTWHGDRGFKKILYDSGKNYNLHIEDNKVVDYRIVGSSGLT